LLLIIITDEKIVDVLFPTISKNNVITTNPSHCFGLGKLDFTPIEIAARLIFDEKIVDVLFPTIGKNNVIATNPSHCFGLGKLDFTPIEIAARLIFVGDAVHHFNLVTR
jgi:hypothetical protein